MKNIISSFDLADALHQDQDSMPPENSMKTLIPTLDLHLCSDDESHPKPIYGGELIVVSGEEGEGKTLFARSLTDAFSRQEKRCLWFSYEETQRQFMKKFGDSLPYFLLPIELEASSVEWIRERIKAARQKTGGDLHAVFIDHLHYLVDLDGKNNIQAEVGNVCRQLKRIAVHEDIAMILIVHTNRSEGQDEPTTRSLRDSGLIGKEADTVLFVWRLPETDSQAMIKIAKARGSGKKNRKVHVNKEGPFLKEYFG
jgi:replicative DNA helicase